ncbi:PREDICTED: uncharacterized protein LOC102030542 [Chinchilla lanigera]|uniref:uncharacterized protein LOC102030542 n=1 Tax=Chinchilla lanigera TaxID=34839 RepID=UPI00038EBE73|nr:PREDICTED: uncharacterized protein LOC102030542 [Chinchilla lanigera]
MPGLRSLVPQPGPRGGVRFVAALHPGTWCAHAPCRPSPWQCVFPFSASCRSCFLSRDPRPETAPPASGWASASRSRGKGRDCCSRLLATRPGRRPGGLGRASVEGTEIGRRAWGPGPSVFPPKFLFKWGEAKETAARGPRPLPGFRPFPRGKGLVSCTEEIELILRVRLCRGVLNVRSALGLILESSWRQNWSHSLEVPGCEDFSTVTLKLM